MRSDWMCTANATHRLMLRVIWCGDCERWHMHMRLEQPTRPSSRRWEAFDVTEWDYTPEMQEWGWRPTREIELAILDLQRLHVEQDAGVQRLF